MEINTREIRLGNYVLYNKNPTSLTHDDMWSIMERGTSEVFKGIPLLEAVYLTPELLIRMGFKSRKSDFVYGYGDVWKLEYIDPWGQGNMDEGYELYHSTAFENKYVPVPFYGWRETMSGLMPNAFILFAHQLQNLFFSVSGQDIVID